MIPINNDESAKKLKFTHIGVREATKQRIEDARKAYSKEIGHKISMAEYIDCLSKVHLPFNPE